MCLVSTLEVNGNRNLLGIEEQQLPLTVKKKTFWESFHVEVIWLWTNISPFIPHRSWSRSYKWQLFVCGVSFAERSRAVDSGSVIYRMWVRTLAWSCRDATLVSVSMALYHNCFSPTRTTNGQELRLNLQWTGILSGGIEIFSVV